MMPMANRVEGSLAEPTKRDVAGGTVFDELARLEKAISVLYEARHRCEELLAPVLRGESPEQAGVPRDDAGPSCDVARHLRGYSLSIESAASALFDLADRVAIA